MSSTAWNQLHHEIYVNPAASDTQTASWLWAAYTSRQQHTHKQAGSSTYTSRQQHIHKQAGSSTYTSRQQHILAHTQADTST